MGRLNERLGVARKLRIFGRLDGYARLMDQLLSQLERRMRYTSAASAAR